MIRLLVAALLFAHVCAALAQGTSSSTVTGAAGTNIALIRQSGTTLPATCSVGQLFFKTNATAGQNIYECASANTWTQQFSLATPVSVANGGTGIASGTSGGVLAFTASGTIASSGALTANLPVIGGGAGAAPTVGTRSGNTTTFATTTGALGNGNCVKIDASGNLVDAGGACGSAAALTNTHIFVGSAGGIATDVALSQDCTMANTGAITCTKTNNASFAASATTDTTNASNISTGTLAFARDSAYVRAVASSSVMLNLGGL